jgi:hypothetical protein
MHNLIDGWMNEPGSKKALQVYLISSLSVLFFLALHLIDLHSQIHNFKNPKVKEESIEVLPSESELKEFLLEYLQNLFSVDEDSHKFLMSHSDANLWKNSLEIEINKRKEKNINSYFKIESLYLESLDASKAKAICYGIETFPDKTFKDRNLLLELVINTKELKLLAIPLFRIE